MGQWCNSLQGAPRLKGIRKTARGASSLGLSLKFVCCSICEAVLLTIRAPQIPTASPRPLDHRQHLIAPLVPCLRVARGPASNAEMLNHRKQIASVLVSLCPVPNAQDDHHIVLDPIPQDVRRTVVISRRPSPASLPRFGNTDRLSATATSRAASRLAAAGLNARCRCRWPRDSQPRPRSR